MTTDEPVTNPYVGPRTFSYEQRGLFFGREREARDLLARVLSERLLLFYAQSGAGKSSLLHTRLIPQLQEEKDFVVLPVGRVGGELPAGVPQVDNIYVFNLLLSIDEGGEPARLAHVTLSDFLARLARRTVTTAAGQEHKGWVYDPALPPAAAAPDPSARHYALVIDQFEEVITSHPARWREREAFFRQLDAALQADPHLWVVLTLREDYVAALDPYAPLVFNRLRGRFYMERMDADAALQAVQRPAELGGRPFATGIAEQLVDNLRQVRVPGQGSTIPGQYVEPVQLQVVCYQLWTSIEGQPPGPITTADLERIGDVDKALAQFYRDAVGSVAARRDLKVSERQLRTWFDRELITEAGTRGIVYQGEKDTAGIPNEQVRLLQDRFLLRAELRAGGTWLELTHDRLVDPVRTDNAAWFEAHLSTLQRQAALWEQQGRPDGLLLRVEALSEAERWAEEHKDELEPIEEAFLLACKEARARAERERRRNLQLRRLAVYLAGALTIALLAVASTAVLFRESQITAGNEARARQTAEASAALAQMQLTRLEGERLLKEAHDCKRDGDAQCAITLLEEVARTYPTLDLDLETEILDVRRQAAVKLAQEGEKLAADGRYDEAAGKFQQAWDLRPPPDAPVYIRVPAGGFTMGSKPDDGVALDNEKPQQDAVPVQEFWIRRTEVTNAQYLQCCEAGACKPPQNTRYDKPQFANLPVTNVSWDEANDYSHWVGGRLPTEAEWEKACRGTDARIYPWGNQEPNDRLLNYALGGPRTWTAVGSYPSGASPFGVLDLAGNVWEWTSSLHSPYPYRAEDGREDRKAAGERVLRGGGFTDGAAGLVRCGIRFADPPSFRSEILGFRVVVSLHAP